MVTSAAPACQALETFRKPQSPGRCLSTGRGGGDGHDARLPPSLSGPSAAPTPHSAAPRPPPGLPPILSSPPEPRAALCHSAEAPDRCAQPGPVRARTERRCQARGAQMPLCERPLRTIFLPPSPHGGERGRGEEGKKELRRENRRKREPAVGARPAPPGARGPPRSARDLRVGAEPPPREGPRGVPRSHSPPGSRGAQPAPVLRLCPRRRAVGSGETKWPGEEREAADAEHRALSVSQGLWCTQVGAVKLFC